MFLRLITDNFTRRPRRKLLTAAALSLGMAVATAALSVSLDVGDRLAQEFRSLGANLVVTPEADSLPLEIGGVDFRPANSGAYLPEADLPKIKTVFWHNNIIAFAPVLESRVAVEMRHSGLMRGVSVADTQLIGTWSHNEISLTDGSKFETGVEQTNPWWQVAGAWFNESAQECVIGKNLASLKHIKVGDAITVYSQQPISVEMRTNFARRTDEFVSRRDEDQKLLSSSGTSGHATKALREAFASVHGKEKEIKDVFVNHELKVTGILSSGGEEDDAVVVPLSLAQELAGKPGQYRKLYVSVLSKPEDDFGRRDPKTMKPDELEKWSCSPYVSSIAYSIKQVLPESDVRVIRRVADGEGKILTRVRTLLWLVTFASLLAAALAVGASSAASVIERRTEIGLMKALGAGTATVGWLLAAEQLLLALVGGCAGYALGLVLARFLGTKIFGVPPEPSLLVLGVILVLAAVVTLLGSALPLRRAARFDPAPILRGE